MVYDCNVRTDYVCGSSDIIPGHASIKLGSSQLKKRECREDTKCLRWKRKWIPGMIATIWLNMINDEHG